MAKGSNEAVGPLNEKRLSISTPDRANPRMLSSATMRWLGVTGPEVSGTAEALPVDDSSVDAALFEPGASWSRSDAGCTAGSTPPVLLRNHSLRVVEAFVRRFGPRPFSPQV